MRHLRQRASQLGVCGNYEEGDGNKVHGLHDILPEWGKLDFNANSHGGGISDAHVSIFAACKTTGRVEGMY